MTDGVFTIARGWEAYYASLLAASDSLIAVLLRGVEADDLLRRHDTLSALLASNTEANFTGYTASPTGKPLTGVTAVVDDDADTVIADAVDFSWATAGGATNNTIVKLVICYKPSSGAANSAIVPVWHWDSGLPVTTDGNPLNITVAADGLWRSG